MIQELRRTAAKTRRGRGGAWGGGGYSGNYNSNVGNFDEDGGGWAGPSSMHVNEMRRQEPLDRGHGGQIRPKVTVSYRGRGWGGGEELERAGLLTNSIRYSLG